MMQSAVNDAPCPHPAGPIPDNQYSIGFSCTDLRCRVLFAKILQREPHPGSRGQDGALKSHITQSIPLVPSIEKVDASLHNRLRYYSPLRIIFSDKGPANLP